MSNEKVYGSGSGMPIIKALFSLADAYGRDDGNAQNLAQQKIVTEVAANSAGRDFSGHENIRSLFEAMERVSQRVTEIPGILRASVNNGVDALQDAARDNVVDILIFDGESDDKELRKAARDLAGAAGAATAVQYSRYVKAKAAALVKEELSETPELANDKELVQKLTQSLQDKIAVQLSQGARNANHDNLDAYDPGTGVLNDLDSKTDYIRNNPEAAEYLRASLVGFAATMGIAKNGIVEGGLLEQLDLAQNDNKCNGKLLGLDKSKRDAHKTILNAALANYRSNPSLVFDGVTGDNGAEDEVQKSIVGSLNSRVESANVKFLADEKAKTADDVKQKATDAKANELYIKLKPSIDKQVGAIDRALKREFAKDKSQRLQAQTTRVTELQETQREERKENRVQSRKDALMWGGIEAVGMALLLGAMAFMGAPMVFIGLAGLICTAGIVMHAAKNLNYSKTTVDDELEAVKDETKLISKETYKDSNSVATILGVNKGCLYGQTISTEEKISAYSESVKQASGVLPTYASEETRRKLSALSDNLEGIKKNPIINTGVAR